VNSRSKLCPHEFRKLSAGGVKERNCNKNLYSIIYEAKMDIRTLYGRKGGVNKMLMLTADLEDRNKGPIIHLKSSDNVTVPERPMRSAEARVGFSPEFGRP